MPDSLVGRVRPWLDKQGYPLEMRTAAAFRGEGFTVRQSQHYVDPDTHKSREIDVVCFVDDELGIASLRIVVECKSGDKPWVVFSSAHTVAGFNRLFAIGALSEPLRAALVAQIRVIGQHVTWFEKSGRVGYVMVQAMAERNEDHAFTATMSAVKASLWQLAE